MKVHELIEELKKVRNQEKEVKAFIQIDYKRDIHIFLRVPETGEAAEIGTIEAAPEDPELKETIRYCGTCANRKKCIKSDL